MKGKFSNQNKVKFAVTVDNKTDLSPLHDLNEFIEWTKKKKLKSYVEIGKLLGVEPVIANKLLHRSILPDETISRKMREVMNED